MSNLPTNKTPQIILDPFTLLEEERDARLEISQNIYNIQEQIQSELKAVEGEILNLDERATLKLRLDNLKLQLQAEDMKLKSLLPAKSIQLVLDSVALKMEALLKMQQNTGKRGKVGRPKMTPEEKKQAAIARAEKKAQEEAEALAKEQLEKEGRVTINV